MPQLIKRLVWPNSKFRIICRDRKFVPQEFIGIWKFGLYADIAKEYDSAECIPFQFEHENISEAESVIERRRKQLKHKKYVVRDYYEV